MAGGGVSLYVYGEVVAEECGGVGLLGCWLGGVLGVLLAGMG